jgi:WD40 repeat protein/serine/threonine protein kinase
VRHPAPGPADAERTAALFAEALALPEAARAAYLDAACAGDAVLRAELESLLAALPGAQRLFEGAPHLATDAQGAAGAAVDPASGRTVGAYRLLELIASGGMGAVYRGERVDAAFRKQVAIKLIRPWLDSTEIVERFRRERQVLADLEHPHIARLIDGGSTPGGRPYLVMEYVDGLPIDSHADAARLDLRARLALFLTVCAAVQYAHRNLVIHRDLKPSNILVDREGRVKLLDFGIAKVLGAEAGGAAEGEHTLLPALTPRYASPEQVQGLRVTTATDVYSLGVLLYELLAGARPYALPAQFTPEAARVICETAPTRPSRAAACAAPEIAAGRGLSPARLAHALGGDLDTILLKALRKEPERRYASVDELAADIRRHLDGLPVLAAPDRLGYRAGKFLRRHRALSIATAGTLLVLVVALFVSLGAYRRAAQQTREAERLAYAGSLAAAEAAIRQNEVAEARARLEAAPAALRGWEWRHLRARLDRSLLSVPAHTEGITRLVFAPAGDALLSAAVDGTVKEWDPASGVLRRSWGPLDASVESIACALDGAWLIVGLGDGRVLRLDRAGEAAPSLLAEGDAWPMVALSPDSRLVAVADRSGRLRLIEASTGRLRADWRAHESFAIVAWSPRGDLIATGGGDGQLKLWDARTQRLRLSLNGHGRRIYSLAISADGELLAAGSMDRSASVHAIESGALLTSFREHRGSVTSIAFTAGGDALLSSSTDGRLLRWSPRGGELLAELRGHEADVSAIAASPDGRHLASGDWSGRLKLWSAETNDVLVLRPPAIPTLVPRVDHAALDPSGRWLVAALNQELAPAWRLEAPGQAPLQALATQCQRLLFSRDGRRLYGGDAYGRVMVADAGPWALMDSFSAHTSSIRGLALHPGGRWLATSAEDSLVKLWDLDAVGTAPRLLAGHRGAVLDLEFSPDGALLTSCGADSSLRLWDWQRGDGRALAGHQGAVLDAAFSPDGGRLASAGADGRLCLWALPEGRKLAEKSLGRSRTGALAWSRDGRRLALAGSDGVVRLLDPESLREWVGLRGHVAWVSSLAFGPGDSLLVSTSRDGTLRVWDAPAAR